MAAAVQAGVKTCGAKRLPQRIEVPPDFLAGEAAQSFQVGHGGYAAELGGRLANRFHNFGFGHARTPKKKSKSKGR
jgi:hypothetical protein